MSKKEKTIKEKITDILSIRLKFYLTEFGRIEDLDEVAREIEEKIISKGRSKIKRKVLQ